jgi:hypothetical protein
MNTVVSTGQYSITCGSCGATYIIDGDDMDWKCMDSNSKQMGVEYTHVALFDDTCPCSQRIWIWFIIHEYPEGIINGQDVQIIGAKAVPDKNVKYDILSTKN